MVQLCEQFDIRKLMSSKSIDSELVRGRLSVWPRWECGGSSPGLVSWASPHLESRVLGPKWVGVGAGYQQNSRQIRWKVLAVRPAGRPTDSLDFAPDPGPK